LWFVKSLPWPLDIRGSKLSFYRNIFLSQYREQKYLVCIGPNSVTCLQLFEIEDNLLVLICVLNDAATNLFCIQISFVISKSPIWNSWIPTLVYVSYIVQYCMYIRTKSQFENEFQLFIWKHNVYKQMRRGIVLGKESALGAWGGVEESR